MKNLRRSIVALLATLAIFYNIERLDIYGRNTIDLPSFVYVISLVAVVAIIASPRSRQMHLYGWFAVWMAVYLVCKFLFFNEQILVEGGGYIYITITEVAFLLFTTFLSSRVALHLQDFEDAVVNISFSGINSRIFTQKDGWHVLQTEINRGRRYQRPVSIVALEPSAASMDAALHRSVREVQESMMSRYVFLSLARIVSQQIRRMDVAMERDGQNRLLIVCPETQGSAVEGLVQRVRYIANQQLGLSIGYGIASFPESALTAEQLAQHAEDNIRHDTDPEQEAVAELPWESDSLMEIDNTPTKARAG